MMFLLGVACLNDKDSKHYELDAAALAVDALRLEIRKKT